jgi:tubulin polyglutamylase TTLL6/13
LTQKINNTKEELVVQEYIDKPLIIENTKFDLRIYVMIKSFTPLKIFIFNEGLARFATENY